MGTLIKQIFPNGVGVGEGIHALLGNSRLLRKLQGTATGQKGMSGYRIDRRSGMFVYHYMGIPFYRCEVPTTTDLTTMYGVNLAARASISCTPTAHPRRSGYRRQ